MEKIFNNLRNNSPLVHCITNYVTANDVANIILASGGSPIMADDPKEAREVTKISDALVINIGTLNERSVKSMLKSGKEANKNNISIIFDPVGIGVSSFRRDVGEKILRQLDISVITGNYSELKYITQGILMDTGVDSDHSREPANSKDLNLFKKEMISLSKKYNCVVESTGPIDVIAYDGQVITCNYGHPLMKKITGSGCMLTGLIGAYVGANPDDIFNAVKLATEHMGAAGYISAKLVSKNNLGTASFKLHLIDHINTLTYKEIVELKEVFHEGYNI